MRLEDEIVQLKSFRNPYHKATVNIVYSGKWLIKFLIETLKPYNLTVQQFNILRILRGQYPRTATVKLIRERMLDKMSDASRIVEKLRIKGLVARNICNSDRRRADVLITPKGLDVLSKIDDEENKNMDDFLSQLNPQEIEQLNLLLDKLRG